MTTWLPARLVSGTPSVHPVTDCPLVAPCRLGTSHLANAFAGLDTMPLAAHRPTVVLFAAGQLALVWQQPVKPRDKLSRLPSQHRIDTMRPELNYVAGWGLSYTQSVWWSCGTRVECLHCSASRRTLGVRMASLGVIGARRGKGQKHSFPLGERHSIIHHSRFTWYTHAHHRYHTLAVSH